MKQFTFLLVTLDDLAPPLLSLRLAVRWRRTIATSLLWGITTADMHPKAQGISCPFCMTSICGRTAERFQLFESHEQNFIHSALDVFVHSRRPNVYSRAVRSSYRKLMWGAACRNCLGNQFYCS